MGYDMHQVNAGIKERLDNAMHVYYTQWKRDEGLALISELALKYPGNVEIKTKHAMMKIVRYYNRPLTDEQRKKSMKEAEDMLRSINLGVLTRQEHDEVLMAQLNLYMGQKRFDEGKKVLEKLRPGRQMNNFNKVELYFYVDSGDWEMAERKFQENMYERLCCGSDGAYNIYHVHHGDHERVVAYSQLHLAILQAVTDGKPSYLDTDFAGTHESISHMYACLGNAEKSLYHFEQSVEYGIRYRSLKGVPPAEAIPRYFNKVSDDHITDMQCMLERPAMTWALNSNERQAYDLIRDTDKFKELLAKIEEHNL